MSALDRHPIPEAEVEEIAALEVKIYKLLVRCQF
jgi:hypothetical protein